MVSEKQRESLCFFLRGKDSTVLLDLVRTVYPSVPAVFVDTGLEYPEIRDFVKTIDNVIWIKPDINFRQVIKTYGYPIISKEIAKRVVEYRNAQEKNKELDKTSAYKEFNGIATYKNGSSLYNKSKWKFLLDAPFLISDRCCNVMKKKPFKKYEKITGNKPFIGTMACESRVRMNNWLKNGCNSFNSTRPSSQPISIWTEQDILNYIRRFKIPYCSIYGDIVEDSAGRLDTTGCKRTGCVFCAFGCHLEKEPNRFQRLKITHPKLWDYCMKPWDNGGLGMKEVLEFLNIKTGE